MLKPYFIRHNFGIFTNRSGNPKDLIRAETLRLLNEIWEMKYAILDYEHIIDPVHAFDPTKYKEKAAQYSIRRMNDLGKGGGVVGIVSNRSHVNQMLIGRVAPETAPELVTFESNPGYFYKGIKLKDVRQVGISKYPGLFSKIPRQTAFSGWPIAIKTLNLALSGAVPEINSAEDLDDSQLEVLCYEYLRTTGRLAHLLLPIGRTLQSLDIVGVTKTHEKVLAQVTFHRANDIAWKIEALKSAADETEKTNLFFFYNDNATVKPNASGIEFIGISLVFNHFKSLEPTFIGQFSG